MRVYMCINTVMMCSGVCMNGEYLIKGNVRVCAYFMSPLDSVTQHRHRLDLCAQVTSWHSVIHGRAEGWKAVISVDGESYRESVKIQQRESRFSTVWRKTQNL